MLLPLLCVADGRPYKLLPSILPDVIAMVADGIATQDRYIVSGRCYSHGGRWNEH